MSEAARWKELAAKLEPGESRFIECEVDRCSAGVVGRCQSCTDEWVWCGCGAHRVDCDCGQKLEANDPAAMLGQMTKWLERSEKEAARARAESRQARSEAADLGNERRELRAEVARLQAVRSRALDMLTAAGMNADLAQRALDGEA